MLNVRLIDRGRLGVEPTPHGHALLKSGAAIFDQLRHGVQEIEYLSDPTVGEVRIATAEPYAAGWVPNVIANFSRQFPRVSIYVIQTAIGSLPFRARRYRDLYERNVDLVLGPVIEPFVEDGLEAEPLFKERTVVVAGEKNRLARRHVLRLADLVDEPWCLPPPDTLWDRKSLKRSTPVTFRFQKKLWCRYPSSCKQLCWQLNATCQCFRESLMLFSAKRFGLKELPVKAPIPLTTVGIITMRNRTINPVAQQFIKAVREGTKRLNNLNP